MPRPLGLVEDPSHKDLMIVGYSGESHIGAHFWRAAHQLNIQTEFADIRTAHSGRSWVDKMVWHFRDHKPLKLREFGQMVFRRCKDLSLRWLLCTGFASLDDEALEKIRDLGVVCINYLTDDPWNPAHRANWFMKALSRYEHVFSVRRANMNDLERLGGPKVHYLPFGYAPENHFFQPPKTEQEIKQYDCDLAFIGGADRDRLSYIRALIRSGFDIHLYGGYWERHIDTKRHWKGYANPEQMRKAVSGAKVNLCLVRRANRDGNSMRTFEIPAMGGCMLLEDTEDHRKIFGENGRCVVYFSDVPEMIEKLKELIRDPLKRQKMKVNAHQWIRQGANTYADRLRDLLKSLERPTS